MADMNGLPYPLQDDPQDGSQAFLDLVNAINARDIQFDSVYTQNYGPLPMNAGQVIECKTPAPAFMAAGGVDIASAHLGVSDNYQVSIVMARYNAGEDKTTFWLRNASSGSVTWTGTFRFSIGPLANP